MTFPPGLPGHLGNLGGSVFRSLGSRNYRLYLGGQTLSLVGRWMHQTALYWLAYRVTDSALFLGLIGFAQHLPILLLGPLAGALADRLDKRAQLWGCQAAGLAVGCGLGALVWTGAAKPWLLVALTVAFGAIQAFDVPLRQSLLINLVEDKSALGNAIALNAAMFNVSRLVGPAAAGMLIATAGEAVCFVLYGLSHLPMMAALAAMRLEKRPRHESRGLLSEVAEGFAYVFRRRDLRTIMLIAGLFSLLGVPYVLLMPMMVRDVLGAQSDAYGALLSVAGGGSLLGALYMAGRRTVTGLEGKIRAFAAVFGLCLMALAASGAFWLSALVLFLLGVSQIVQLASCNILVQTAVDDDKRGRTMSTYYMLLFGLTPIGSFLAGQLADAFGVQVSVFLLGLGYLLGVGWLARRL